MLPSQNPTWNQHFQSQAEQRLNAADPPACSRIYSFRVEDKETPVVRLEDPNGVAIRRNLSFRDLFSLDVDGTVRTNLEVAFGRYEDQIRTHSERLIEALRVRDDTHLKADLVGVFAAKLLNFTRNPFSAGKGLNTFGAVADYEPTNPEFQSVYEALVDGNRPQRTAVCDRFGLTAEEYLRWLRTLVILLLPSAPGQPNPLERVVKAMLETHYVEVFVHDYGHGWAGDACLLSDRAFTYWDDAQALRLDFNLCAHAFITFVFCEIAAYVPTGMLPHVASAAIQEVRGKVTVRHVQNDREALKLYNGRVVYQCAERVFSATPTVPEL